MVFMIYSLPAYLPTCLGDVSTTNSLLLATCWHWGYSHVQPLAVYAYVLQAPPPPRQYNNPVQHQEECRRLPPNYHPSNVSNPVCFTTE